MDPCGTLVLQKTMGDDTLPTFMKDIRLVSYNLTQLSAGPVTKKELSSLFLAMKWLIVWKAVEGSRVMRMVVRQRSTTSNISLTIFKSNVFVELSFLYADWRGQEDSATCGTSQAKYRRSSTLLVVFRFDFGLLLAGSVMRRPRFFRSSVTWAEPEPWWENALTENRLAGFVMIEVKISLHSFRRVVEIRSLSDVLAQKNSQELWHAQEMAKQILYIPDGHQ